MLADTNMVIEVAKIYDTYYNKESFTLAIPDCFNDMQSKDANFEMSVSNTTQPLYLEYEYDVVTNTLALIFVNPQGLHENMRSNEPAEVTKARHLEKGKIAKKLFTEEFNFQEVDVYTSLPKAQIIEQLKLTKYHAQRFE